MSVLLILIIVHETNNVLTILEVLFVNALVAIDWWMELVKVIDTNVITLYKTILSLTGET